MISGSVAVHFATWASSITWRLPEVIVYTPFLAKVFAVCPLDWHDWAARLRSLLAGVCEVLVMTFSFPVIIVDEVLKFFGRQYQKHKDAVAVPHRACARVSLRWPRNTTEHPRLDCESLQSSRTNDGGNTVRTIAYMSGQKN